MATLFDRLFVEEEDKIAVHYFFAALVDFASGNTTKQQIIDAFNLDVESDGQLDTLIAGYQASGDKVRWLEELHSVMMLAEGGFRYTTPQTFATRMGL